MHAKEKAILVLVSVATGTFALQSALPVPERTHFTEEPIEIVSSLDETLPSTAPVVEEPSQAAPQPAVSAPATTPVTPEPVTPDPEPVTPDPEPVTPDPEPAPAATASGGSGVVEVTFNLEGDAPALAPLDINPSAAVGCHADGSAVDATDRSGVVNNGKVEYVVVTLEPRGHDPVVPLRAEPQVLDQIGCRFEPHVLVVREGETVSYRNSDGVNHNVNLKAKKNAKFSLTVPPSGSTESAVSRAEEMEARCDIHPWMSARVLVVEQPYFGVSGPDGSLRIEGVAAGDYRVEFWHESMGKGRIQDITVTDGQIVSLEHALAGGGGGGGRRRGR